MDDVRGVVAGVGDDPVGPLGRGVPVLQGVFERARERGDALREHEPEHNRERPQLGERQQLDLLVALHERLEVLRVDGVVGQRGEALDGLIDAREALERAGLDLRQQPVVRPRERVLGLAELVAHERVVVDEPLGGRRQRLPGAPRRREAAVGGRERPHGLAQDGPQRAPPRRLGLDRLRPRQPPGVLGEVDRFEEALDGLAGHGQAVGNG